MSFNQKNIMKESCEELNREFLLKELNMNLMKKYCQQVNKQITDNHNELKLL